jgi:predicted nucleotidyltransferase
MSAISLDISGKIKPDYLAAIAAIKKTADALSIPFFLVGATARDFILEHCYHITAPRRTTDIDFGVQVENWAIFIQLEQALQGLGWTAQAHHRGRYLFQGVFVDLVPFGGISGTNH